MRGLVYFEIFTVILNILNSSMFYAIKAHFTELSGPGMFPSNVLVKYSHLWDSGVKNINCNFYAIED